MASTFHRLATSIAGIAEADHRPSEFDSVRVTETTAHQRVVVVGDHLFMAFTRFSDSASRKYRRAQYHYRCLTLAYMRLQNTNLRLGPHRHEVGPGRSPVIQPRIQPNQRWGVMIGDCVQNLREALDHAAYQLVPEHIRSRYADNIEFPIFDDATNYEGWKKKRGKWIGTIDAEAVQIIDKLQPCSAAPADPHGHVLWKLYRLSNIDKHRTIHLTFLGIGQVSSSRAFVVQAKDPKTGTVVIAPQIDVEGTNVKLRVTVQVAFATGEDLGQLRVFPTLLEIGRTVRGALNRLRRYMV